MRLITFSNGEFPVRIGTVFRSVFADSPDDTMTVVGFKDCLIIAKSSPDSIGEIWYAPSHMQWEEFIK